MPEEPCHLCGSHAVSPVSHKRRVFLHCDSCDLIFASTLTLPSAGEEKARYLEHNNTRDNPGYVTMLKRVISFLEEYGVNLNHVLDYGSGPAPVMVDLLREAGFDATGWDPFFANDTAVIGVDNVGGETPSFEAIVSVETFEHFADPRLEMERIAGLLQNGGLLIIQTLFHRGPETIADWWYARDPTHVTFYSHATLNWICQAFGLNMLFRDEKNLTVLRKAK